MGMYDTIWLGDEISLPNYTGNPSDSSWQTKDLDCMLDKYKIKNDEMIYKKEVEYSDLSDEEKEEKAKEEGYNSWEDLENDSSWRAFSLDKKVVDSKWVPYNLTGSVEIYHYDKENDFYWSYDIIFKAGVISDIIFLGER